jgi:hypothetical protein
MARGCPPSEQHKKRPQAREIRAFRCEIVAGIPGDGMPPNYGMESANGMNRQSVIKMRSVILCYVLFLVTPLFAGDNPDVILMKNGDRFTGEIKGLSGGVLYISVQSILGTSQVQWSKVAHLESKRLFLVKTEDGAVYTGSLNTTRAPGDKSMEIAVAETSGKSVIESSDVVEMEMTSAKFFRRFNGNINTGVIYSKGNQSTQYSLGSQIAYPRESWAAGASLSSSLSASTGATASTRNQLDIDVYRLMRWNNWFYEGLGGILQSTEQGIVHQTTFGGGIGRYVKNSNAVRISMLGGFSGQNTAYQQNIVSQNLASGVVAANLEFFRFDKTNGSVRAVFLPGISDPNRVKFNLNATYYIKLTGNLSWNISVYGNWDSRPPPSLSGSDYGSSSGLSWTFGNKWRTNNSNQ